MSLCLDVFKVLTLPFPSANLARWRHDRASKNGCDDGDHGIVNALPPPPLQQQQPKRPQQQQLQSIPPQFSNVTYRTLPWSLAALAMSLGE